MRDEAWAGVRGGLDGRSRSRVSCSFSFLHISRGYWPYDEGMYLRMEMEVWTHT